MEEFNRQIDCALRKDFKVISTLAKKTGEILYSLFKIEKPGSQKLSSFVID